MAWKKSYLKVPRSLFKTDRWKKPFTKGMADIDLYYLANFKSNVIHKRGIPINLEPGQVGYSMRGLADRWGWSEATVKRYIKCLKNEGQIEVQISKVSTTITLLNYIKNDGQNERKTTDKRRYKRSTEYKLINEDINVGSKSAINHTPISLTEFTQSYPDLNIDKSYKKFIAYCGKNGQSESSRSFRGWCEQDMKKGWNLKGQEFHKTPSGLWKAYCSKCNTQLLFNNEPHTGYSSECCGVDLVTVIV